MGFGGRKSTHARPEEPKVKGVAFKSVLAVLDKLKGEGAADAALALLSDEQQEALRFRVIATHWYPIGLYRDLWDALIRSTSGGPELAKAIGRECAHRDLTGVHRFAFRLLSPETIFSLSNRMFGTYYDTGTVETVEARHGYARAVFTGCEGFDRWMWTELLGSTEMMFELARAKHVRVRWTAGGVDGPDAELVAMWAAG